MSEQERDKLMKGSEDPDVSDDDVEAHVKATRSADDDDDGDDVEAHVKQR